MGDLASQLNNFRNALQMQGEHKEGTDGGRGDLIGTGDSYESFTWPKAVEIIDTEGEGVIRYPYDGMFRHKHYIAQVETSTEDIHYTGMITANYTISRSGKVFIADIHHEVPQQRRCGNAIINRLTSMNGQTV